MLIKDEIMMYDLAGITVLKTNPNLLHGIG